MVVPATLRWQRPDFFGYFPALASLLGDLLSGGLGAQGMLWSSARAGTEVEQGVAYLTHTVVDGRYTIRVAIGGVSTDGATVDAFGAEPRDITDTLRPRSLAIGAPGGRARRGLATDGTITSPC